MKKFSIIVAVDKMFGIGRKGALPWRLSRDMQHFKELTVSGDSGGRCNAVVMGRKTWDSLPAKYKPLPSRLNVVISSRSDLPVPEGVALVTSFERALEFLEARKDVDQVFIIGGGVVFTEAIAHPACDALYLTLIEGDFECDVLFPALPAYFQIAQLSERLEEGGVLFRFCQFRRQ